MKPLPLAALTLCASAASAAAQTALPHSSPQPIPSVSAAGGLGMALLFLVLLAAAALYISKHGLSLRGIAKPVGKKLLIEETRSLGGRQFLVVVSYEENRMLLGVTPGKIDYLCTLDAPAERQDFSKILETQKPPS